MITALWLHFDGPFEKILNQFRLLLLDLELFERIIITIFVLLLQVISVKDIQHFEVLFNSTNLIKLFLILLMSF